MYKLIVKTRHKTFIKKRSKDKDYLEKLAVELSSSHPRWTVFVVSDSFVL